MAEPGAEGEDEVHRRRTRLLLAAAALGVLVRAALAAVTLGSNDYFHWRHFGRLVAEGGLSATYAAAPAFNHPPLAGGWGALVWKVSSATGAPFGALFKLAPLAADVAVMALLWALWRSRGGPVRAAAVVALFAWSPVSILITGFHCNTDPVHAALCLLAAWLLDARRAPLAAGLALSAALHVKLIPVVFVAPLAACCRDRRELARFGAGLAVGAAAYLPWVLGDPAFTARVLGYRPRTATWGVPLLLGLGMFVPAIAGASYTLLQLNAAASATVQLVASGLVGLRARARAASAVQAGATAGAAFLVLAAGFGHQYLVAPLPLLFAVRPRHAAAYSVAAGAFSALAYATAVRQRWPLAAFFEAGAPRSLLVDAAGLVSWALLAAYLLRRPLDPALSARSDTPPPAR